MTGLASHSLIINPDVRVVTIGIDLVYQRWVLIAWRACFCWAPVSTAQLSLICAS